MPFLNESLRQFRSLEIEFIASLREQYLSHALIFP